MNKHFIYWWSNFLKTVKGYNDLKVSDIAEMAFVAGMKIGELKCEEKNSFDFIPLVKINGKPVKILDHFSLGREGKNVSVLVVSQMKGDDDEGN